MKQKQLIILNDRQKTINTKKYNIMQKNTLLIIQVKTRVTDLNK